MKIDVIQAPSVRDALASQGIPSKTAKDRMTAGGRRTAYHSRAFFVVFIQGRVSSPLALAVISLSLRPCMVEKA